MSIASILNGGLRTLGREQRHFSASRILSSTSARSEWAGHLALICVAAVAALVLATPAAAQSFRVQCPTSTITHPNAANNNSEPPYTGPTTLAPNAAGFLSPTNKVNGAIKCQQVGGGDGYASMADGTQTYMFSFSPLSGLANITR